jgi:type I restriction enzyme R subunit
MAIRKLRRNERLSAADLKQLDALLFESGDISYRRAFALAYGPQPNLPAFLRSLVGMDRAAAKLAFSRFLLVSKYNPSQIQFVNTIIDYLTLHGTISVQPLNESRYADISPLGIDGFFYKPDADAIVGILAAFGTTEQSQWAS